MADLFRILEFFIRTRHYSSTLTWDHFRLAVDLMAFLDHGANRMAVSSQLDCLACQLGIGRAPLTLQQLRYLVCSQVAMLATALGDCCRRKVAVAQTVGPRQLMVRQLTAEQRTEVHVATAAALEQMKRLDPANPINLESEHLASAHQPGEAGVLLCLRMAALGRVQGSDWYIAVGGWRALMAAAFASSNGDEARAAVRCSILQQCVSAYEEAKASGGTMGAAREC
jgi:hypothetical protein